MEISIQPATVLRIKGKQTILGVDPKDYKGYAGILLLTSLPREARADDEHVVVSGTGEYEIGGIKITGTRCDEDVMYSLNVEGVEMLIGKLTSLEKYQHKLKEYNVIVVQCNEVKSSSFLTSLATNTIIFYGAQANEVSHAFGRENTQKSPKYTVTKEKLPQEMETIILE
jgi:hypothetical protein